LWRYQMMSPRQATDGQVPEMPADAGGKDPWALLREAERTMRRDVRVIGLLVLAIAIILFLAGATTIGLSRYTQERYEEPGGELLRGLSPEDQQNYENAKASERFGGFLVLLALIALLVGIAMLLRPGIYRAVGRRVLRR